MPLAIWAWDDFSVAEVLDAAIGAGLRVPEQVAVLGTQNEALVCEFAPVRIDAIERPVGVPAACVFGCQSLRISLSLPRPRA